MNKNIYIFFIYEIIFNAIVCVLYLCNACKFFSWQLRSRKASFTTWLRNTLYAMEIVRSDKCFNYVHINIDILSC